MADHEMVFKMILAELSLMVKSIEHRLAIENDHADNCLILRKYVHTMKKSIIDRMELQNADYGETIEIFCKHFEDAINHTTGENKAGFIFLFVRDDSPGNIDIASNLATDCMKRFLSDAHIMIEDERNKNWDKTKH